MHNLNVIHEKEKKHLMQDKNEVFAEEGEEFEMYGDRGDNQEFMGEEQEDEEFEVYQ